MTDEAPKAKRDQRDALDASGRLWYQLGDDEISPGKADTYPRFSHFPGQTG
jgi:hypothetical protein